ncbi:MAG: hypothetical protein JXR64_02850 [Spirochaetales bacterium]|nr:hypothetical protein [Spirochaetales bacterium]
MDDQDECIYNEETGECIPESDIIASLKESEWEELRYENKYLELKKRQRNIESLVEEMTKTPTKVKNKNVAKLRDNLECYDEL